MGGWLHDRARHSAVALGVTLHEAIALVLLESGEPRSVVDIQRGIVEGDLYRRGDGDPPTQNQIHARVSNYPDLFYRPAAGMVGLSVWRDKPAIQGADPTSIWQYRLWSFWRDVKRLVRRIRGKGGGFT